MITPVLLCGGPGTRLWPLSRKSYPKQFAALPGDRNINSDVNEYMWPLERNLKDTVWQADTAAARLPAPRCDLTPLTGPIEQEIRVSRRLEDILGSIVH